MKNHLIILFIILMQTSKGQEALNLTPPVKSVTLYQRGALVTHEVDASLGHGKTTVYFHGLPSGMDKQSIQLSSTGEITILSVTSHEDYLSRGNKTDKERKWQDSLEILSEKLTHIKNGITNLQDSRNLLDNNRSVGGANTGTTVAAVKAMYEFYTRQITHIEDSIMSLQKKQAIVEREMQNIRNEINDWKGKTDTLASTVEAVVSSDSKQDLSFRLSYFTYDAGWSPKYDLRAKDTKHPCMLSYKADVYQHTGEDWSDIDLTLSSNNPSVNQTAPILAPWFLTFYTPRNNNYGGNVGANMTHAAPRSAALLSKNDENYSTTPVNNQTTENQLSVEFHIDIPYNLPSDQKPHTVEIKQYNLNAFYEYFCIPKLQKNVYLLAGVTDWEELNLMDGAANIYYAEAYIGKSSIDPESTLDTMNFSLGMDKKIVVKRTKVKNYTSDKWFGNDRTQTFTWEITLHNTHTDSATVNVYDQVPLTTDKDIEIRVLDNGGASLDEQTGKMHWLVSLASNETKKLTFSYSVKHPKDKPLANLR